MTLSLIRLSGNVSYREALSIIHLRNPDISTWCPQNEPNVTIIKSIRGINLITSSTRPIGDFRIFSETNNHG